MSAPSVHEELDLRSYHVYPLTLLGADIHLSNLIFAIEEHDLLDFVSAWNTNVHASIARLVICNHVNRKLRFQTSFVHCESVLVRPVLALDEFICVHFDYFFTAFLVRSSRPR